MIFNDQLENVTHAHSVERAAGASSNYRTRKVLFLKQRSRVATRVSAYVEDSSTKLTDERRLPLIVRSPKNLQKEAMARRREGDKREGRKGGKGGERIRGKGTEMVREEEEFRETN